MSFSKYCLIIILDLFFFGVVSSQTMEYEPTTFRLYLEAGGGYSYKLTQPKFTLGEYTRDGIAATVRIKWGSSKFLGIGVESGWIPISSTTNNGFISEFGNTHLTASLSAIPVLVLFSIQRFGIQLHAGLGYYLVASRVTIFEEQSVSSEWNMGYLLSLGYARPVSSDVRIGAELKWHSIVEQQLSIVTIQLKFLYRIFGE